MKRTLVLLFSFLIFREAVPKSDAEDDSHLRIDFDSDLLSWNRLKRDAGYFTESYVYKGGLYKEAIDEQFKFYHCVDPSRHYCKTWTASERVEDKEEKRTCRCIEGDKPYCASWKCYQEIESTIDSSCDALDCTDKMLKEETYCDCSVESPNGNTCAEWNCIGTEIDGSRKLEVYTCLEEDISGKYCFRWRGKTMSETEIDSSACQCMQRGDQEHQELCVHWICKERGIERCEAYGLGWCKPDIALGVGGGFGAAMILVGLGMARPTAERNERLVVLIVAFAFGCLPWTVGVVIWGGIRTLPWVMAIWLVTLTFSLCFVVYSSKYPNLAVSQVQQKSRPVRNDTSIGDDSLVDC